MQQQQTKTSSAQYMQPGAATGGFFPDIPVIGDNAAGLGAPALTPKEGRTVYEPSPLSAAAGWPAILNLIFNVVCHAVCWGLTIAYAAMHLPPKGPEAGDTVNGGDYTAHHSTDFVRSWIVVMITCESLCVLFTLFYFGCVYKAMSLPIAGHIGLALQLIATVSATKLSYFIAIAPEAEKVWQNEDHGDAVIVAIMYLGWVIIAGYIMTPISGNYYKIVTLAGSTEKLSFDLDDDTKKKKRAAMNFFSKN